MSSMLVRDIGGENEEIFCRGTAVWFKLTEVSRFAMFKVSGDKLPVLGAYLHDKTVICDYRSDVSDELTGVSGPIATSVSELKTRIMTFTQHYVPRTNNRTRQVVSCKWALTLAQMLWT